MSRRPAGKRLKDRWVRPLIGPPGLADPVQGPLAVARVALERAITPRVRRPALLDRLPAAPVFDLVGVYRARNAVPMKALAEATSGSVRLWSLDEVHPALRSSTVGSGPGTRFENLNRLLTASAEHWLVVADDDARMTSGSVADAVRLAAAAHLDLAMPGHDPGSAVNWEVTRARPQGLVRLTRFIDQGPVLVMSPAAQARLLPFDESLGMGWGAELVWGAMADLRIGVLDGVRMRHLAPVSRTGYDVDAEWARTEQILAASPWSSFAQAQAELGHWRRWQSRAPWVRTL